MTQKNPARACILECAWDSPLPLGAAALMLLLLAAPTFAQVVYVDASAGGAQDGTSWSNAFKSLRDALSAAFPGDQVWVAAGTYRPDEGVGATPGDRAATFQLLPQVELYGGFAGAVTPAPRFAISVLVSASARARTMWSWRCWRAVSVRTWIAPRRV